MAKSRTLAEVPTEETQWSLFDEETELEEIRKLLVAHLESKLVHLKWVEIARTAPIWWVSPAKRIEAEVWPNGLTTVAVPDNWYIAFERQSDITGYDVWTVYDFDGEMLLPAAPIGDFEYAGDDDFDYED